MRAWPRRRKRRIRRTTPDGASRAPGCVGKKGKETKIEDDDSDHDEDPHRPGRVLIGIHAVHGKPLIEVPEKHQVPGWTLINNHNFWEATIQSELESIKITKLIKLQGLVLE